MTRLVARSDRVGFTNMWTRAVTPLEKNAAWEVGELPETYPFAV